jgi:hypothetical protein
MEPRSTRWQVVKVRIGAVLVGGALFGVGLQAQFGTEAVADQDIGRPPRATLITFLGIVNPGKMATDPSLPMKGPVEEVLYEEFRAQRTAEGPAGEPVRSIRTTYDSEGRPVEEISTEGGMQSKTISRYEGKRLVSQEMTVPTSKTPLIKFWNYWRYDTAGRLTEYRRGKGDELQNHDLNFKRDSEGRLVSFEYRQTAKDEPGSRTEVRYSDGGKTAEFTYYDAKTGEVTRSVTQTEDGQGHVVRMEFRDRDWKTKAPKTPLKVRFVYDDKGRLIEQNADDHEFDPSGSENEVPPGKISILYDDEKHTKATEYLAPEGRLSATLTFDETGATVGFRAGTGAETIDARLDCAYDSYGNWTACRQVVQILGSKTDGKSWRRTITYR